MAAYDAWKNYGKEPTIEQMGRYSKLYSWWDGTWRNDAVMAGQRRTQPALYRNTRQVWRQSRAIASLYAQFVYQGALSRDGQPLPDGTRGAIPIDPQVADDERLVRAISELFAIWNWSQYMTFLPKMGAILGDYLTELVDDVDRGVVLPSFVWPGYVTDLELDLVGNVKRYAIEHQVTIQQSKAFGQDIKGESYRFRKEVDGQWFRLYKDDKPHAYPELGFPEAEMENPYGFCPATWDRHEIVPGQHGLSAIEATLNQTLELNGILSHALDYQQKQFAAPVGVVGKTARNRNLTMPGGISLGANPTADEIDDARRASAENLPLLELNEGGQFVTIDFDIGKTMESLQFMMDSILAENPEARYGQEILKMSQVTGPGMERILGPIVGPVIAARANYDAQTVKRLQMAIAIMGFRLQENDYPPEIVGARPDRYRAFEGYDLTSYGKGDLDFAVAPRPVFPETPEERANRLVIVDSLSSDWAKREAGVPEEEIAAQKREAEAARREMAASFSVASGGDRAVADDENAA